MSDWRYLRSYSDPGVLDDVFAVMDTSLPFAPEQARVARRIGLRWEDVTTPFVRYEDGMAVTHLGVLETPMVLDGRDVDVGRVHAVCTRPEYRRRGLYRSVMDEVLAWCDERYETLALTTGQAELYEPFGFRLITEHRFVGAGEAGRDGLRQLDYESADDRALMDRLLREREPVSHVLGVRSERKVFLFNEARRPPWYAEALDLLACIERDDGTLRIFDLVGPRVPSLAEFLEHVPPPVERVEVYFSPDRLDADLAPEPHKLDGVDLLLVRGPWPDPDQRYMLPRTVRC